MEGNCSEKHPVCPLLHVGPRCRPASGMLRASVWLAGTYLKHSCPSACHGSSILGRAQGQGPQGRRKSHRPQQGARMLKGGVDGLSHGSVVLIFECRPAILHPNGSPSPSKGTPMCALYCGLYRVPTGPHEQSSSKVDVAAARSSATGNDVYSDSGVQCFMIMVSQLGFCMCVGPTQILPSAVSRQISAKPPTQRDCGTT